MSQFDTNRKTGLIAITLKDDDKLIAVSQSSGDESVYVITKKGKSITFPEDDVRSMGRSAGGVRAISLDDGDEVVSMELDSTGERELLVMTKKGFGKRTNLDEYRVQTRGGKGVATYDKTKFAKTGELVGATLVRQRDRKSVV